MLNFVIGETGTGKGERPVHCALHGLHLVHGTQCAPCTGTASELRPDGRK